MRAAGIHGLGEPVEPLDLPEPRALAAGDVLIQVAAAGVGNWDEIARTGGWDLGVHPPMALGVEAAGKVVTVGEDVTTYAPGDEVLTHAVPLGAWAERCVVPANLLTRKPASVSWAAAAGFPVPALTAEQVLTEALEVQGGQTLLVHGASGLTGGLIVQLAAIHGLRVIATASPTSEHRVRALGASEVLDYHDPSWPSQVLRLTDGVPVAANAARGGAALALSTVMDGGRLATITSDLPAAERGVTMHEVYVRPDAHQLATLTAYLGEGQLMVPVAASYPLSDACGALKRAVGGAGGGVVAVTP